ncbi:beta-ketoacyl synthase chain length factor [Paucibacter sp. Y2R2-4]|uniref:beta-ketoacyl synthase chain length factor n=1 Tax=Paucibacter sp. Y2R2-4 TaxID=2893553 RepID=UPI0021E40DB2|nr:beta-ketoacyl synthase chain length factor [Paucibacter sp. Y2R2-4]MCV2350871.1 beta-ketoacyl synthase chain length factor [Paucibacter sp. Y2R2-4]
MSASFSIQQWAAWAPGLESESDWRSWFAAPHALLGAEQAALAAMPAMMRRRIDPLGRAALQSAYEVQPAETIPLVFASRWGELARSVGMLEQLAQAQPLSPTAFSLSVHNAIGALYSIARGDRSNYQAVSAGAHSAEAGFAEAQALLADGAAGVLLVVFDAALPDCYSAFRTTDASTFTRAWACLLRPADAEPSAQGLRLTAKRPLAASLESNVPSESTGFQLPSDLRTLEFLIGQQAELRHGPWHWERHGV